MRNDDNRILKYFYFIRGVILLIIGLILGFKYLGNFNIIKISTPEDLASIGIDSYIGGFISMICMAWGFCDIFFNNN